jgi:hypothetical protein
MTFPLEYHKNVKSRVQPSIPASLALCAILLLPLLLVSSSSAQVNNGVSSTHASASAPSVAPPVRNIAAPDKSVVVVPPKPHPPQAPSHNPNGNNGNQHNPSNGIAYYPYFYPVPYAVDASSTDASTSDANANDPSGDSDSDNDPEYQGGPTIFDRRGSGTASYVRIASPRESSAEQAQAEDAPVEDSSLDPEPPQAPTILVFKDGHQLEVSNYAIVSPTLYDLTPGHPRKIALSALDIPATEKLNDDHGIVFELPPSAQAN